MARKSNKRGRVSREHTQKNAKEGSGGGNKWLNLPDGVTEWAPEKPGTYLIDIIPYEVADKEHPDNIDPGMLWYKRQFAIHHNIGIQSDSIPCPLSVKKPCPICEEMNRLKSEDKEKHEDVIKDLRPQQYVAFNILDPEDMDKHAVFSMSFGKFAKILALELQAEDEAMMDFYHVENGGHTIKARFAEATFAGNKYMQCGKIDFRKRADMEEDDIIEGGVCLDEILNVMEYDKLKDMFHQIDDGEGEKDGGEEETPHRSRSKKKASRTRKPKEEEPEDEEEPEEPEVPEKEEEPVVPECPQCNEEFEEEDGEEGDNNYLFCSKKCMRKYKEANTEPEEKEEKEEEPEPKSTRKKSSKKASKKTSKKSSDGDDPECPEGGTFGKDCDKFDPGCDECPHWDACDEASRVK